jgi:hypothetical protein
MHIPSLETSSEQTASTDPGLDILNLPFSQHIPLELFPSIKSELVISQFLTSFEMHSFMGARSYE